MVADSEAKTVAHVVLAAVLQVREDRLQALLWQRAREPYAGCWALPGGALAAGETLEESMRRHLAEKVDVRELSHLEQLETRSDPGRNPAERELATAYLGLVPTGVDPAVPADTRWHPVDALPRLAVRPRDDPAQRRASGCARSSPTRISASPSHRRPSRSPSCATSTRPRSATRCRRRTSSASCSAAACSRTRASGGGSVAAAGGRRRSTASAPARSRSPTSSPCSGRLQ